MKYFKKEERKSRRNKKKTARRYSSDVASNVFVTKPRGRRLKGEKRKVNSSEPAAPPVMARTAVDSSSGRRTRQRKTIKRRFDISLGVAGAEARLPALPVINFGWRFVSGMMFVLMAICLINLWSSPAFKVESVQVDGVERLTQGDINTVLGVIGESVFLISPDELEENLLRAFPEMISVDVEVALPAEINVSVDERVPILSLLYNDTEYWVDKEGVAFNPRGNPGNLIRVEAANEAPGILQLNDTGTNLPLAPQLAVDTGLVSAVQSIGEKLPEGSLILYDLEHGLGWYDAEGWEVYFGQGDNIEMKLSVYGTLVENLMQEGIYPSMISVEHVHAPYFRVEQ